MKLRMKKSFLNIMSMLIILTLLGTACVSADSDIPELPTNIEIMEKIIEGIGSNADYSLSKEVDKEGRLIEIIVIIGNEIQTTIIKYKDDGTYKMITDSEFTEPPARSLYNQNNSDGSNFPDVDNSHYANEIDTLNNSGIISGDENGNFRPNDGITRAEIAAILCRAIGISEETAHSEEMKSKNYFTDVVTDHWAAGYINAAFDFGAINGYGGGIFAPDEYVTNEQVIKMLVASWGYTEEAESLGGYPNGYMEIAHKYGVLDTVSFNYGNASKRWVVSMFVYGVLEKLPILEAAEQKPMPPVIEPIAFEEEKKPLSEYQNSEPNDIISILKRITPESAKYEEKIYFSLSNNAENFPFYTDGNNIVFRDMVEGKRISMSIAKDNSKENYAVFSVTEAERNLELANLPSGEWEFYCSIIDGAVKDTYICSLEKANSELSLLSNMFRAVTLNAQPEITEDRTPLVLSNSVPDSVSPFTIQTTTDNDEKILLSIDCSEILTDEDFFEYNINTLDSPVEFIAEGRIDGRGTKIESVIIETAKPNTSYHFSISARNEYGNSKNLKGTITFTLENNEADFILECDYIDVTFGRYEITDY